MQVLTLPRFNDFHRHLRQGAQRAYEVEQMRGAGFGYVVDMPNKSPIIATADDVRRDQEEIRALRPDFRPLSVTYLTAKTTPETIDEAFAAGVVAVKYFPQKKEPGGTNVTTNSGFGVHPEDLLRMKATLKQTERRRMPLLLHAEHPDSAPETAERDFLHYVHMLAIGYPYQPIVIEHLSEAASIHLVETYDNVACTVTPHHLLLTRADVDADNFKVCKPLAKTDYDRSAIRSFIQRRHQRCFAGTDHAPHPRRTKETPGQKPSYGIAHGRYAPALYATILEELDVLEFLPDFLAHNGEAFYGLPPLDGTITLVREPETIPDQPDPDLPRLFWAGKKIPWRLAAV